MRFFMLSLLVLSGVANASEIQLAPGASVVIRATETATVSCAGGSRANPCTCTYRQGVFFLDVEGGPRISGPYNALSGCVADVSVFPACR